MVFTKKILKLKEIISVVDSKYSSNRRPKEKFEISYKIENSELYINKQNGTTGVYYDLSEKKIWVGYSDVYKFSISVFAGIKNDAINLKKNLLRKI